jgi:hypothetical protein
MGNKIIALILTILFTIIILIIGCYYGILGALTSLAGLLLFAIIYNTILLFIED